VRPTKCFCKYLLKFNLFLFTSMSDTCVAFIILSKASSKVRIFSCLSIFSFCNLACLKSEKLILNF
jgi:hypothetical protein